MTRNQSFQPEGAPLRGENSLQLNNDKIHGPFAFLNPTQAHFQHLAPGKTSLEPSDTSQADGKAPSKEEAAEEVPASNVEYKWTSRNNRKGRHALVIRPTSSAEQQYKTSPPTNGAKEVLRGIWRMFTYFPVWDISYLVAVTFTWGSVIWVINAMFSFLPFTNPKSAFPGETLFGGGITAFIGATVFEIGSVLLMLEAVNENRAGCFGWALEEFYEEHLSHDSENGKVQRIVPSKDNCTHHHTNKRNLVGKPKARSDGVDTTGESSSPSSKTPGTDRKSQGGKSWVWWPSADELRAHYLYDLGFLACATQMFAATVFWISGITALPGVFTALDTTAKLDGAFWVPQIIGGAGFIVSGTLFMIETQKHWWQPAFGVLGWHIGLWNLIGGVGFTICPIFGLFPAHWAAFQSSCSTFWGSWAFLIGSAVQWYESLDKYPVESSKDT